MTDPLAEHRLPYPGLRSFRRDETDLFFGRETSVNQMIRRLAASRFLAVLGASGSGKSSLVRTGLLDGLELGLLAEAGSWWRIIDIRPGGDPLRNMARGLCKEGADEEDVEQMRAFLLRGPRSIAEWASTTLAEGENVLILVDQFEELFRYQHYEGRQEAEAFVALLVESAKSRNQRVYVTLTMRSEFLGACALFGGLAEAMNDGQYLTPRMARDKCRMAIEGPAAVCGFRIEPALVNRLLNDLSDFAPWEDRSEQSMSSQLDRMVRRADQLPLLQHALNRLWIKASEAGGDVLLKLSDYDALGGLRGALNQHAREIMDELGPDRAPLVEQIFRALTVGSSIADAVRRPTRVAELVEISGAKQEEIVAICDAFRQPGRNFLSPFPPTPLRDDTFIDISHESLIRQWSDLSGWLEKESRDAEAMRRLGSAAALAEADPGDYLRGRELANLEAWRADSQLSDAWAQRYVNEPTAAFGFLDESVLARQRRDKAADDKIKADARAARRRRSVIAALAVLVATVGGYSLLQSRNQDALKAKQEALEENQEKLVEAQKKTEDALQQAQAEKSLADEARAEVVAQNRSTSETIRGYVASTIDKQQQANDLANSGDQLAALAKQFPVDALPAAIVDRLAWQAAAESAGAQATDTARPRDRGTPLVVAGFESANTPQDAAFSLWRNTLGDDADTILVIDRKSGRTVDRFDFPADSIGQMRDGGDHFLSPDGKAALFIGKDGRLFRWSQGDKQARRVLDRRWIKTSDGAENSAVDREVKSAAFDPVSGDIAVVYSQFAVDHVTVIPLQNADLAPSWPAHRFAEQMVSSIKTEGLTIENPVVRAVGAGKPLVEFGWEDVDGSGKILARLDLAAKTAVPIADPARIYKAYPTSDPAIVRLEINASTLECAGKADFVLGPQPEDRADSDWVDSNCVVDYDLSTQTVRGQPRFIPLLESWASAPVPFDLTAGFTDMTAPGKPGWRIGPPDVTANDTVTRMTFWRRISNYFSEGVFRTKVVTREGMRATAVTENGLLSISTIGLDRADGTTGAHFVPDPSGAATPPPPDANVVEATPDGAGRLAVAFSRAQNGKAEWWVNGVPDADGAAGKSEWAKIGVKGATSCVNKFVLQEATKSDDSDGPNVSAKFKLTAVSTNRPDFLVLFKDKTNSVGRLTYAANESGNYVAEVECLPEAIAADRVLAIDVDSGHVALFHGETKRLTMLDLARKDPGSAWSFKNDVPTAGDFVGEQLVLLTDTNRLFAVRDGDIAPHLIPEHPLPNATGIYGGDRAFLLVRPTDNWMTAAAVAFDPATGTRGATTHLGLLPIRTDSLELLKFLGNGQVDILTGSHLFGFQLPAVPAASTLVASLDAVADISTLDDTDRSLFSLLATAMDTNGTDLTSIDEKFVTSTRCATTWMAFQLDLITPSDIVTNACADTHWPTPAAVLELRSDSVKSQDWPKQASLLLSQAAAGDTDAFLNLAKWLNERSSDMIAGRAGELLVDDFRVLRSTDSYTVASSAFTTLASANPRSADLRAHLALAAAAEKSGKRQVEAFVHYAVAEKLASPTGRSLMAVEATSGKIAAAKSLSAAERVAARAQLDAWTAEFPAATRSYSDYGSEDGRLLADIAIIDELAGKLGKPASLDLLKLHLLRSLASAGNDDVQRRIIDLLLSRSDWPNISIRDDNEFVRAFETAAGSEDEKNRERAMRLRLAGLRAMEFAGEPLDLDDLDDEAQVGSVYARMLHAVVEAGPDAVKAASDDFKFGDRAVMFSNVRFDDDPIRSDRVLAVLKDRLKLAEYLQPRADASIAVGATKFWIAVNRYDYARANTITEDKKASVQKEVSEGMQQAVDILGRLPLEGDASNRDALATFLSASVWLLRDAGFSYKSDEEPFPPVFEHARQAADMLFALTEAGKWSSPWETQPGQFRLSLDDEIAGEAQLGPQAERPFGTFDDKAYALRMRNIALGAARTRIVNRGGIDDGDDQGIVKRYSVSPAYAMAFVAGRERTPPTSTEVTRCDQLASHEGDPKRRAPGKLFRIVEEHLQEAIAACEQAWNSDPDDETTSYILARLYSDSPEKADSRRDMLKKLADRDYAIAFNNLSSTADKIDKDFGRLISLNYRDHIFRHEFQLAHAGLLRLPADQRDDAALKWMAEQSASLGSFAANLQLAHTESDPAERKFRYLAAVKCLRNDNKDATLVENQAAAITLSAGDEEYVKSRIEAYSIPESPRLSDEHFARIKAADKSF